MAPVRRLIGVYNAKGTLLGELSYFVGKRFGRAHCALCDITHGLVSEKEDWKACQRSLGVPMVFFHLDDQPPEVAEVSAGRTPCVLAESDDGVSIVLDPDQLEACNGDPAALVAAINTALEPR